MPDAYPDRGEIRFRAHRDVGSVMNATVAFLRGNARELLTSYVALVAPVALAGGIALGLYFHQMGGMFADPMAMESDPFAMFNLTYAGLIVFSLIGTALTTAAAAAYVRLYREGMAGEITAGLLWEEAKGLMLPVVGLSVVYGLVVSFSAVIAIVPCLGILAWFAFVVWSIPYFAVTLAARMLDEPTLLDAYQRARDLVKGSWGPTFGALLLAFLLFYVVIMLVSIPLYVALMVIGINTVETDPAQMFSLMGAVMAPLQVISYAGYLIPLVAMFFVYGHLAEEMDGTSLSDDLDVLAGDAPLDGWIASAPAPSRPAPPASTPPSDLPDAPEADGPDAPDDPPGGFRGGGFRS
ncbi:hypothetical protein B1759_15565 [Rubrivirga sp. SAORIC476]|uniref:hypothetical protein n=1 Tax=Rubrivirga sp. SAORIC476 TaxID=1961794 RepID=UPI000BDD3D1E|nr:hypothetical protein [Rubrivirga sp. SAORIC476]PAP79727.1 hypothetical protein B1759_15565 [Rubrivirga sp. SAORIC476]